MGKNANGGDDQTDYVVGLMFLALVLIVGLALLGEQVASVLNHS
jgi:hypothetical protein